MTAHAPTQGRRSSVDLFCDLAVLLLGVWTLVCNLVVHASGRPVHLAWAAGGLATLVACSLCLVPVLCRRWPRLRALSLACLCDGEPLPVRSPVPGVAGTPGRWPVRALLAAAGAGCLSLSFPGRGFFVATTAVGLGGVWLAWRAEQADGPGGPVAETPLGRRASLWLWAVAGMAVAVTLCAHRPDRDDAFYLGLAASLQKYPHLPLLSFDPMHAGGGPIQMSVYRLHALEPLMGLLSWASGVEVIYLMHTVLPALGALLVVLGAARLLRLLLPERYPYALAGLLLIYLLDGGRNQGYANFAFVRLFQGKAIYASALVPLLLTYGLRFGRAPNGRRLLLLAAAQVAALGATASALPSAPLVAGLGVLAGMPWSAAGARGLSWSRLRILLGAGLSSAYLLGTGLYFYLEMHAGRGAMALAARAAGALGTQPMQRGKPLLEQAFTRVLGEGAIAWWMLGLTLVAPALLARPLARRLAALLCVAFFGLLANPWLTGPLSASVFGVAAFWRIFWVLPMPILAAMVAVSPGGGARGWACGVLALGLSLSAVATYPVLSGDNRVGMGRPGHHALPRDYWLAGRLAAAVPEDSTVVATIGIAGLLPALPKRVYPVFIKKSYLRLPAKLTSRRQRFAACFGRKRRRGCSQRFVARMLTKHRVQGALLHSRSPQQGHVRLALRLLGFSERARLRGHTLWLSEAAAARQRPGG